MSFNFDGFKNLLHSSKLKNMDSLNVFGQPLVTCSKKPLTGFFRDGNCNVNEQDTGLHSVCIIATEEFLEFSKSTGNDLSTPNPLYNFEGVKPGDKWCLVALRFLQAVHHNAAPKVYLEATNERTLEVVSMDILLEHAYYKE